MAWADAYQLLPMARIPSCKYIGAVVCTMMLMVVGVVVTTVVI